MEELPILQDCRWIEGIPDVVLGRFSALQGFSAAVRAAGVPARVVTGYQGGESNPIDGFVVIRQSDAHAWAEVWLAGPAGRASTRPRPWRRPASRAASSLPCPPVNRCRR